MPFLTQLVVDDVIQVVDIAEHLFLIVRLPFRVGNLLVPGCVPLHTIDCVVLPALSHLFSLEQAAVVCVILALLHDEMLNQLKLQFLGICRDVDVFGNHERAVEIVVLLDAQQIVHEFVPMLSLVFFEFLHQLLLKFLLIHLHLMILMVDLIG